MNRLVAGIFVSLLLMFQSVLAVDGLNSRIIGGADVAAGNYNFYAALMAPFSWTGNDGGSHWNPFCGGTYLGDGYLLTAAHCTELVPNGATFAVALGNRNGSGDMRYEYCTSSTPIACTTSTEDDADISGFHYTHYLAFVGNDAIGITRSNSNVMEHPAYRPFGHDLALIKLPGSPSSDFLNIPTTNLWVDGNTYTVVGHGDTLSDQIDTTFEPSAELREVDIPANADSQCRSIYGSSYESDNMLCAGSLTETPNFNGKDSCQGDSGGPLFDGSTLIGVVSWGGQCARYYGVYADVYAMRHWLNTAMSNLKGTYQFPQAINFGAKTGSLSETLTWTFRNASGTAVTLADFDFDNLSSGYSVLGNGCLGTLSSSQSCTLTLRANFRDSGYHNDSFTFTAGSTRMEVNVLARVIKKSKGGSLGFWTMLFLPLLMVVRARRLRSWASIALFATVLSACSSMSQGAGEPEVLFNPDITSEGLEFSVVSHGCTENDHLFLRVEGSRLTLLRTQQDMCRTAPQLLRFVMPLPATENVWQIDNPVRYSNRLGRGGAE